MWAKAWGKRSALGLHARPRLKISHNHVEGCGAARKRICHGALCSLNCQRQFQNFPIFLWQRLTQSGKEMLLKTEELCFLPFFCWLKLQNRIGLSHKKIRHYISTLVWLQTCMSFIIQWKTKGEILKIVLVVLITMNHLLERSNQKKDSFNIFNLNFSLFLTQCYCITLEDLQYSVHGVQSCGLLL